MFQFTTFPLTYYRFICKWLSFSQPGSPIRISTDRRICAPNRSFSQLITSFFGSWCQGILPTLFFAWSTGKVAFATLSDFLKWSSFSQKNWHFLSFLLEKLNYLDFHRDARQNLLLIWFLWSVIILSLISRLSSIMFLNIMDLRLICNFQGTPVRFVELDNYYS